MRELFSDSRQFFFRLATIFSDSLELRPKWFKKTFSSFQGFFRLATIFQTHENLDQNVQKNNFSGFFSGSRQFFRLTTIFQTHDNFSDYLSIHICTNNIFLGAPHPPPPRIRSSPTLPTRNHFVHGDFAMNHFKQWADANI
jgi:hypothetical protein